MAFNLYQMNNKFILILVMFLLFGLGWTVGSNTNLFGMEHLETYEIDDELMSDLQDQINEITDYFETELELNDLATRGDIDVEEDISEAENVIATNLDSEELALVVGDIDEWGDIRDYFGNGGTPIVRVVCEVGEGEGSVGGDCGGVFEEGENATITADPLEEQGYMFINWSGDTDSEESEHTFTDMEEDKEVTANFETDGFIIECEVGEGEGSIGGDCGDFFEHGDNATVTAEPEEGYEFSNWEGNASGPDLEHTFTFVDEDKTAIANFEELEEYDLEINIEGEGETEPSEGNHSYHEGETIEITAEAEEEHEFVEWTGACSGDEECEITIEENEEVTAIFEEEENGAGATIDMTASQIEGPEDTEFTGDGHVNLAVEEDSDISDAHESLADRLNEIDFEGNDVTITMS